MCCKWGRDNTRHRKGYNMSLQTRIHYAAAVLEAKRGMGHSKHCCCGVLDSDRRRRATRVGDPR